LSRAPVDYTVSEKALCGGTGLRIRSKKTVMIKIFFHQDRRSPHQATLAPFQIRKIDFFS